jgi:hypothetical protein
MINSLKDIMTPQVLRCIYFTYIYANLRNGSIFWSGIHKGKVFLNCKSELHDSLVMQGDILHVGNFLKL